jgi:hypothetical protein
VRDRTVARRVQRYRVRQMADRGIKRVEVQVPYIATGDIKNLSSRLLFVFKKANDADKQIKFVLGTINAPRPYPIDAQTLVHCLMTSQPDVRWRPHIEALFDEVSAEAIHDLVLAGLVSFEDLYRAARNWRVSDAGNVTWIKEMADLRLAEPAA